MKSESPANRDELTDLLHLIQHSFPLTRQTFVEVKADPMPRDVSEGCSSLLHVAVMNRVDLPKKLISEMNSFIRREGCSNHG